MTTITPVIFAAPRQRPLVDRLVRHCKELDGTVVKVIAAPEPTLPYPDICNWAFIETCRQMAGKTFFWLEADSIPLRAGWLKEIEKEWEEATAFGKSILWTSDSNPPDDLCCGVGVYGPDTLTHLPESISQVGFDGWLMTNCYHLIHRTPIIQHSYGSYANGKVSLWRHPKPRDTAVIFHKDQFQDLITTTRP